VSADEEQLALVLIAMFLLLAAALAAGVKS
jgi:hypothetical protein